MRVVKPVADGIGVGGTNKRLACTLGDEDDVCEVGVIHCTWIVFAQIERVGAALSLGVRSASTRGSIGVNIVGILDISERQVSAKVILDSMRNLPKHALDTTSVATTVPEELRVGRGLDPVSGAAEANLLAVFKGQCLNRQLDRKGQNTHQVLITQPIKQALSGSITPFRMPMAL